MFTHHSYTEGSLAAQTLPDAPPGLTSDDCAHLGRLTPGSTLASAWSSTSAMMAGVETVGARQVWRQWPDIAELFRGPNDPDCETGRDKIADELRAECRPVPSTA